MVCGVAAFIEPNRCFDGPREFHQSGTSGVFITDVATKTHARLAAANVAVGWASHRVHRRGWHSRAAARRWRNDRGIGAPLAAGVDPAAWPLTRSHHGGVRGIGLVSGAVPVTIALGSGGRSRSRRSGGCPKRRGTHARCGLARAHSTGCLTRAAAVKRRRGIGVNRRVVQAPLAAEREALCGPKPATARGQ